MTKVTLTKFHQNPPSIKQSRLKRDWMDETYNKHAYRCLPMTAANVNGWEIILQQDVVVQWDGDNSPPKVLEGEFLDGRAVVVPSIIGIISFATGWAINTEDGYDTWVTGSPNYFVDGAIPLSATIPSSWWPDEFNNHSPLHMLLYMPTLEATMLYPEHPVSLFRNGRNQAVRIPREFELDGHQALMRKEGDSLIITPIKAHKLLYLLAQWGPLEDEFDPPHDPPPQERDLF